MASTSTSFAAQHLLECCLAREPWPDELLRRAMVEDEGRALFSVVIERLCDLFDPHLCTVYAHLMSRVLSIVHPPWIALELLQRYERIRHPRVCTDDPKNVVVLSRVTLGADVAVTSVILDGLKRRFPQARIYFVGPRKNWELFAADARIEYAPLSYPRAGTLVERLSSIPKLITDDAIVVDPDSRLSQLGVLPVCEEDRYYFFESRAYGADSSDALPVLTGRWMEATFGMKDARPYIAAVPVPMTADVAVSLGVGANPEKRLDARFERSLLQELSARGLRLMVDKGSGQDEASRVSEAMSGLPNVQTWSGSYAPFASMISQAKLYVGYDSAGQHVAAASATPLISVFAGYASDRMFDRWRPTGPGPAYVLKVAGQERSTILEEVLSAADRLLA